jgi:hypothetical protein
VKAITVWQPWAWAITHGGKDVENRSRAASHRGLLAIHAGKHWDDDGAADHRVIEAVSKDRQPGGFYDPMLKVEIDTSTGRILRLLPDDQRFVLGAIVAVAELVDVTRAGPAPWAQPGQVHWLLANARPLAEPVPCRGQLNVWEVLPEVEAAVLDQLS